ncbi:DUF6011 domain-containing protein [Alkalicoccobacillus gibsonii]|uniref:DUF6011 domain-containing protein n=1 Tax=Alkalicoccobacillus gibsonii TaxID=79881 RepID=UPI001932185E|nr:DUF6011 domain-containing protein [Alkalicoccobacillus gibsonii]MBM0064962.1 hypothetical protein [Alkalicoccobacillus gibsonii]
MEFKQKQLINALIASKIHGWTNVTKTGSTSAVSWFRKNGESVIRMAQFNPVEDLNQAIEAAENMGEVRLEFKPGFLHQATVEPYQRIGADQLGTGEGPTASYALVQAILAAAEIMVDQFQSADDLLVKGVVDDEGTLHYKCLRCNHPLRSRRSQIIGYGPECLKKQQEEPDLIDLLQQEQDRKAWLSDGNFMDELTRKEAI